MTSKERVRAFFRGEETDRVPINMAWNPLIRKRVEEYFETENLNDALGIDFSGVWAPYIGPEIHKPVPGRNVNNIYGWRTRWIEHGTGGYWDYCDFPLKYASVEEVKACIMNTIGFLRGMDQIFLDLGLEEEAFMILADKLMEQHYTIMKRTLEAGDGKIDFLWMGEDLGTQIGPFISKETFRNHILPRHKKFYDLAKEFNVSTLQPEAADMSPEYLKKTFGGRLVFHGCIASTGALSFGTPDDVEKHCIETLKIMMPGGGYAFSPTHALQDNTPLENVIRMYETVHRYGWYK